jgi:hypothetical protein
VGRRNAPVVVNRVIEQKVARVGQRTNLVIGDHDDVLCDGEIGPGVHEVVIRVLRASWLGSNKRAVCDAVQREREVRPVGSATTQWRGTNGVNFDRYASKGQLCGVHVGGVVPSLIKRFGWVRLNQA